MGKKLSNLIESVFKVDVIITDREKVIAATKGSELINKLLDEELIYLGLKKSYELLYKYLFSIYFYLFLRKFLK